MLKLLRGPRTNEFFELLALAGKNALAAARAAEARFRDYPGGTAQAEIKALEHEGDRITSELVNLVNSQFVTPFDRDDLFVLAGAIDDVTDAIENATELLDLYAIEQPTRQSIEQCGILVAAVEQLDELLRNLKGKRGSSPEIAEIKRLEDEGDEATRRAVGSLFEDERIDPLLVIRWKQIYEALEHAIDAVETAAHRIGNILVKNA
jgi:predicted phosphate transport protein (TIGR00153 family)